MTSRTGRPTANSESCTSTGIIRTSPGSALSVQGCATIPATKTSSQLAPRKAAKTPGTAPTIAATPAATAAAGGELRLGPMGATLGVRQTAGVGSPAEERRQEVCRRA
jgi:hypothetical protein